MIPRHAAVRRWYEDEKSLGTSGAGVGALSLPERWNNMQDDIFIIDGVAHAFNMDPTNFADPKLAGAVNDLQCAVFATQPPGYALEPEACARDWTAEDTANILFRESRTDAAVFHTTPIYFYKDGLSGLEKSLEGIQRWPNRFVGAFCAVDPLQPNAIEELRRQASLFKPIGLKLYPISYSSGTVTPWHMDDPQVAWPLFEAAAELGINHVAVHKSVPLGPAPAGDAFRPGDIEATAARFPDMTFEVVHGGMAFNEEMSWLLARFPNVYLNLETLNLILVNRPRVFAEMLAGIMHVGGEYVADRLIYASGAMNCHPQPTIDAFMSFTFPDDILERYGQFWELPQITHEFRQKLLGGNIAALHGWKIDDMATAIADDEFVENRAADLATPYSTTPLASAVLS